MFRPRYPMPPIHMSRLLSSKLPLLLWLTGFLCLAVIALARWPQENWLAVDFQALLPGDTTNPWIAVANQETAGTYEGQIAWLIEGESAEGVRKFALKVETQLVQSGYADTQFKTEQHTRWQKLTETLLKHRRGLLVPADYQLLQSDPEAYFERFRRLLYSPLGGSSLMMLEQDPSGLFASYLSSITPKTPASLSGDAGVYSELLITDVPDGKLSFTSLPDLYPLYQKLKQEASQEHLTLLATGAPLYTAYGVRSARQEMSTIGLASLGLLSLLLLLSLRSLAAVALTLTCIFSGVAGGLLVTISVLQQIHILMLVFGASLIGIAADYALHYLAHSRSLDWNPELGMAKVNHALRLSLLSSACAFGTLLLLPFPGIRQIGLFMASGLVCSYLTVYLLFPVFYRGLKKPAPLGRFWRQPQWQWSPVRMVLPVISLLALIVVAQFEASDDVRGFYAAPDELTKDQDQISIAMDKRPDSRYLLLEASTPEALMVLEHQVVNDLSRLQEQLVLASFQGISRLIPPPQAQVQSSDLLRSPGFIAALERHMELIGLSQDLQVPAMGSLVTPFNTLDVTTIDKVPLPAGFGGFLGCESSSCASRLTLENVTEFSAIEALADRFERVTLIDQVTSISNTMGAYRGAVSALFLVSVVLIALFLTFLYGWRMAVGILTTPVATCIFSLLIVSFVQGSYSLINLMALLLLIGVSLDYSIFRAFTPLGEQAATALAISLSAATSILAFGILGFSDTPVIRSFGQTIAVGLVLAWVFSWLQLVDEPQK